MLLSTATPRNSQLPARGSAVEAREKNKATVHDDQENIFVSAGHNNKNAQVSKPHQKVQPRRKSLPAAAEGQIVTVNQSPVPIFLRDIVRDHFVAYHQASDQKRPMIVQQALDVLGTGKHRLRETSIAIALAPALCCDMEPVTKWISALFHEFLVKVPGAKDVVCKENRNAPPSFQDLIIARALTWQPGRGHASAGQSEEVFQEIIEAGHRFLQCMGPRLYFHLDNSDPEVHTRVMRSLDNRARSQARRHSTNVLTTPLTTGSRKARSMGGKNSSGERTWYDDTDDEADSEADVDENEEDDTGLPPAKRPKLQNNPSLSSVKVGARLAIYWLGDSCYYGGEVARYTEGVDGTKNSSVYFEYDDGQNEWVDLTKVCFMMEPCQEDDGSLASSTAPEADHTLPVHDNETTVTMLIKACSETADFSNLASGKQVGLLRAPLGTTFEQLRKEIEKNHIDDGLSQQWKFYIPRLAAVSTLQEAFFTPGSFSYTSGEDTPVLYIGPSP